MGRCALRSAQMGPDSMGAAWIWGQVGYQGHGADGAAYPGHPRRVRAHLSHLSAHLPISRLGLGQGIFDHGYTGVPALMLGYERTRRSLEVPGITPWPPTPRAPTALLTWPVWCAMGIWDTPPCRCFQLYDRARYLRARRYVTEELTLRLALRRGHGKTWALFGHRRSWSI